MGLPGLTRAMADQRYANLTSFRRRDLPGLRNLPALATTLPTLTPGTANAASTITSGQTVRADMPGSFRVFNTTPRTPSGTSPGVDSITCVAPAAGTTAPTWGVEFDWDTATGSMEIKTVGQGGSGGVRVVYQSGNGLGWQYASTGATFSHGADGAIYLDRIDFPAAGQYRVRLEMDFLTWFMGVIVGPTDSVMAAGHTGKRIVIVGDSYTEPVIIDSGTQFHWDGYAQLLTYLLGSEVIPAGIGGTGYLATNGGTKPKFGDRLADVYALAPDEVWWMGSVNDRTLSASGIQAAALACYQAMQSNLPRARQVVFGPQALGGHQTITSGLLAIDDAVKAATATAGVRFIDLLRLPTIGVRTFAATTLAAAASAGAASISTVGKPENNSFIQIGASGGAEIRRVGAVTGSGPYTVPLDTTLTYTHASGDPVAQTGRTYITGTGRQGTLVNNGSADRLLGSDATHPTKAGHRNLALTMYSLYAAGLPT